MKRIIQFLSLSFVASIVLVAIWSKDVNAGKITSANQDITLKISSTKGNYTLGEIVNLNIELTNGTPETIRTPSVENGYMHIWIASSDKNYKEYRESSWGLQERSKGDKPSETFKS